MKLRLSIANLILGLAALAAESGGDLFQKAVTQERAGKMEEAIKLYEKVAHDFTSDHALAAKALMAAAHCTETLGQDSAAKLYEQVTRDYSDQRELADVARAKLAALRQPAPTTLTLRQIIPLGLPLTESSVGGYLTFFSDGQHALYLDNDAGGVVLSDLNGKNKRVIFKNSPGKSIIALLPSRDFSMIGIAVVDSTGIRPFGVVKADGTGYHESYKGPLPSCNTSFSWDNRRLVLCQSLADGGSRLVTVSLADGEIHEVLRGRDISGPKFSPDGRFIAYSSAGQTFVVSSQGGEPQLVFGDALVMDWTRDGRYLAIASDRAGATALSLLPVRNGKAAGEPVFVRYGGFTAGWTTASGALVYTQVPPKGYFDSWMVDLDERGNPGEWKRLNLSGSSGSSVAPALSADGARFAYATPNLAAGQNTWTVRLRDVVSGEERELYENSAGRVFCISAAQHPSLFCELYRSGMTELFSLALDSGRVDWIASLPGTRPILMPSRDDSALYMVTATEPRDGFGLIRWETATGRETTVERDLGFLSPGVASLDERWVARMNKGAIEIRPMQGGTWKRLVSRRSEIGGQFTFTPDGEWFLYHDKDSSGKDGFFRVSTAGGDPERLSDFPSNSMGGFLWISRNGRKLIAEASNPGIEFWMLENYVPQAAK